MTRSEMGPVALSSSTFLRHKDATWMECLHFPPSENPVLHPDCPQGAHLQVGRAPPLVAHKGCYRKCFKRKHHEKLLSAPQQQAFNLDPILKVLWPQPPPIEGPANPPRGAIYCTPSIFFQAKLTFRLLSGTFAAKVRLGGGDARRQFRKGHKTRRPYLLEGSWSVIMASLLSQISWGQGRPCLWSTGPTHARPLAQRR